MDFFKTGNGNKFNAELAYIIADLLYEQRELIDQKDAEHCSLQALMLYEKSKKYTETAFPIEASEKIAQLYEELKSSSRMNEIKNLLS